jgi:Uma2 family endonuclease
VARVHAKLVYMVPSLAPEGTRPLRRVEYDKLVALGVFEDERIELLRGALVPMSPIGPPHSATIDRLTRILVVALLDRATVRVQNPFAALDDSEPEPDVNVVPVGDYDSDHPERALVLIEVAESSLARDRGIKLQIYAENGVPEYWVVNLVNRRIEVYSNPSSAGYETIRHLERGQSIRLVSFPDVEIQVSDVLR